MGADAPPAAARLRPARVGAAVRQGGARIHCRDASRFRNIFGGNFEWEIWKKKAQYYPVLIGGVMTPLSIRRLVLSYYLLILRGGAAPQVLA